MSKSERAKWVVPDEKTPRLLGTLNLVFAGYLLFFGFFSLSMFLVAPLATRVLDQFQTRMEQLEADNKKVQLDAIAQRELAAETEADKKALQLERSSVVARRNPLGQIRMSMGFESINHPTMRTYGIVECVTAATLQIAMIFAGWGLIHLIPRGRKFALVVAALQIVMNIALIIVSITIVLPVQMKLTQAQLQAQFAANPGAGQQMPKVMANTKGLMLISVAGSVFGGIMYCTYPTVVLVLLNKVRVRAAFRETKPAANQELTG